MSLTTNKLPAMLGGVLALLVGGMLACSLSSVALAQSQTGATAAVSQPQLAAMAQAAMQQDYIAEVHRRFRQPGGNVVTVRERQEVKANGTSSPDFQVTFLSVLGQAPGSQVERHWRRTYEKYSDVLFRHGSFRVRDLSKASSNYTVFSFGQLVYANRTAERLVVYPNGSNKAIWVVYADVQTSVPLYVAEFDNNLQLFAEIEVVKFVAATPSFTPATLLSSTASQTTVMPTFAAAKSLFSTADKLVDPDTTQASGFDVDEIEVRDNPLNGRRKLVMSYTDGIDQFMIVQEPGVRDPFAGLPSQQGNAHTIARFSDPALSAMVFWDDAVSFHVAGRGSLKQLDDVAQTVFRQALAK